LTSESAAQLSGASEPQSRLKALRHRDFATFWAGLLVSYTGTWMHLVAQGWLVVTLTDSPRWLGVVAMAEAIPYILLPPLGGALADRVDRIRMLKVTQSAQLLVAVVLASLSLLGVVTVRHVIVLAFLSSSANALDQPTRYALVPDLVPERDLLSAVSLDSITFHSAALAGPALAGLLIGLVGFGGIFTLNALSYMAVLLAVFRLRASSTHRRQQGSSLGRELKDGLVAAVRTPVLLGILLLICLLSLCARPYMVLMPAFAKSVLEVDVQSLGLLYAGPGLGTLIGGLALASVGDGLSKQLLLWLSVLALAGLLVAFALSSSLWPAVLLLCGVGVTTGVFAATTNTLLQIHTPDFLRGRIMSYYTVALLGLSPLGGSLSAFAASAFGVRAAILAGGALFALLAGTVLLISGRQTAVAGLRRGFEATEPDVSLAAP
jgi:MFS family permease